MEIEIEGEGGQLVLTSTSKIVVDYDFTKTCLMYSRNEMYTSQTKEKEKCTRVNNTSTTRRKLQELHSTGPE